jgi:calcium-binding protein CML
MGKDFSDDQIKSMKDAFSLFDSDKDGRIAPSDLGVLMRALGGNPTQTQLAQIIKSEGLTAPFDVNRFLELMRAHLNTDPFDAPLRDAFKVIDKESTGRISVKDLRHILTSIGEKLEGSEFDEWIKEVEVGPDGTFKYEDLVQKITAK